MRHFEVGPRVCTYLPDKYAHSCAKITAAFYALMTEAGIKKFCEHNNLLAI